MARPRIIGSLMRTASAAEQRVGDADADEPDAERRHEGRDLEPDMDDAVDEADAGADDEDDRHGQRGRGRCRWRR